jgi:regulator of chromosome condensation
MLNLFTYGMADMDQFEIEDDDADKQSLIPIYPLLKTGVKFNTTPDNKIYQIACGAMHTLVLSTMGKVFSFGCADDGVLGRGEDPGFGEVIGLNIPIDGIVAGDSHSIAYNTKLNKLFYWGSYRVRYY